MRGHHCGKEEKVLLWQNFPGLFVYLPQDLKKKFPSDDILMETIKKKLTLISLIKNRISMFKKKKKN